MRGELDFERGPIRPPSEARSLFLRVVRNCPWNRCTFCPVYKNTRFEARSLEELLADVGTVAAMVEEIRGYSLENGYEGTVPASLAQEILRHPGLTDAFRSVGAWLYYGEHNIFLQDADPLVMKTEKLAELLRAIRNRLPFAGRITAYSRASTTARLGIEKLKILRDAGLDRVHTGLESGSARVLEMTGKGATPEQQIRGGRAVTDAGLELSLYIMPGLGGREWSGEHARETAKVINAIEPNFIRLRTLAVPPGIPLFETWRSGEFEMLNEDEILAEIRRFLENLTVCRGRLESDHILNLLGDLEGNLPDDIPSMIRRIDEFLALPDSDRILFQVGRRAGVLRTPDDIRHPARLAAAKTILEEIRHAGMDPSAALQELMMRFI